MSDDFETMLDFAMTSLVRSLPNLTYIFEVQTHYIISVFPSGSGGHREAQTFAVARQNEQRAAECPYNSA